MNVLIVTPIFPPDIGGPATYVSELVTKLPSSIATRVITFSAQEIRIKNQELRIKGRSLQVLQVGLYKLSFIRQAALFWTIWSQLAWADVLYVQGTLTVGLAAMMVCWLRRKPYVVKYVGDEGWEGYQTRGGTLALEEYFSKIQNSKFKIQIWSKDTFIFKLQKLILSRSKAVITPGRYLKGILKQYYAVEAVDIPNAIKVSDQYLAFSFQKIPKKVVCVGRLVPWKNVDDVIKTLSALIKAQNSKLNAQKKGNVDTWQLIIIGSGPEENNLKKLVTNLQLEKQVQFTGKLTPEQTYQQLREAEYCVLYSSYEGLSHTLLEAMATRCKIIASDIPPNQDVLNEGELGKLIPLYQPDRLAQSFEDTYADTMINKAVQTVQKYYTWKHHLELLLPVLNRYTGKI